MGFVNRFGDDAIKVWQALHARVALRKCTDVGALTRVKGRIIVSNAGRLRLGRKVKLVGSPVPIELVALPRAELTIGDGTFINRGVSICAQRSIRIGCNCSIGNDCLIFDTDFHSVADHQSWSSEAIPVTIGDNVWLAARSIILKGVTVGDGSVVCAGSVVVTNVAPYTMVGGVPAHVIRELPQAEGAAEQATGLRHPSRPDQPDQSRLSEASS